MDYTAAASLLGYLYQCTRALVLGLEQIAEPGGVISIESLDDVAFESGEVTDLLQLKHHVEPCEITDFSPELWKPLRNWLADYTPRPGVRRVLVTTSTAPPGGLAERLTARARDPEIALEELLRTCDRSNNRIIKEAGQGLRTLHPAEQRLFIESIEVADGGGDAKAVEDEIDRRLRIVAYEDSHRRAIGERLRGWWFRIVIPRLLDDGKFEVSTDELNQKLHSLRDQYTPHNLPVHDEIWDLNPDVIDESARYVRQARLCSIGDRRLLLVVRDYMRAFHQRDLWLDEAVIDDAELARYERKLKERWQIQFSRMEEDLGDDATREAKEEAARALFAWVEDQVIAVRRDFAEDFVTRGSYHMLADDEDEGVGWHLDFEVALASLLESATQS